MLVWWMCERARRKIGYEYSARPRISDGRRCDPDGRLRRLHRLHVDVPAGRHHRRQARVHEAGRAGVVRPRAAQHRPALRPRRLGRVQDDGDAAAGRRRSDRVYHRARVVPPRAAPRRPRGAGVEQPRRVGVADGRGRARRQDEKVRTSAEASPRRRSAARRSCASRRRSSPRRPTTVHRRPGHAGRADPRRRARRASEPGALRGGAQGEGLQLRRRSHRVRRALPRRRRAAARGRGGAVVHGLAWTAADWRHLGGALACCTKLRVLYLTDMGAGDAAMAAARFGGARARAASRRGARARARRGLARGAVPALWRLCLRNNKIGDEGMRHLGDALARGAAPALTVATARRAAIAALEDARPGLRNHLIDTSRHTSPAIAVHIIWEERKLGRRGASCAQSGAGGGWGCV